MLEGRGNTGGLVVVGLAVFSLIAFAGLLYVRGGSGPPIALSESTASQRPPAAAAAPLTSTAPSGSPRSSGGTLAAGSTPRPTPGRLAATATPAPGASSKASPSAAVAGATSRPSPTRTPRPTDSATPTPTPSPTPTPTPAGYRLPRSPQPATVALVNGQGGCPGLPSGLVVETSFSQSNTGRLTVTSPANNRLSGRLLQTGEFSVSGTNPVERWVGTLSGSGGVGSYFVVSNGCTEGYETTIAFHP
jgi:hypothetical protein